MSMAFLSDTMRDVGIASEINIFATAPNQVSIQKIYYNHFRPISALSTDDAPIEFSIPAQGADYIDLKRSRLYMKCKIVSADGTALAADDKTGIINMPLQAMFSSINTEMNQKSVSFSSSNYALKSYLKVLLSSGKDTTESQLTTQLIYYDDPDFDDDGSTGNNRGLTQRWAYTKQSREFDMSGPIYEDVFRLDKYIINGVDIHIKMYRNPAPFIFMSPTANADYKLQILDCVYKVACIRLDPGISLNHAEIIKSVSAKYPMVRTEVKTNTIATGSGSYVWENIWSSNLPDKAMFAIVYQDALNGNYKKNPFHFLNLASDVSLFINGELLNARGLHIDVTNKIHATALASLYEGADMWNKNLSSIINRSTFHNGYTIYAFNIAPTDLGEQYINLVRQGSVRLEIKFESATTTTLSCIAYGEFSSLLEIDESRDVRVTR